MTRTLPAFAAALILAFAFAACGGTETMDDAGIETPTPGPGSTGDTPTPQSTPAADAETPVAGTPESATPPDSRTPAVADGSDVDGEDGRDGAARPGPTPAAEGSGSGDTYPIASPRQFSIATPTPPPSTPAPAPAHTPTPAPANPVAVVACNDFLAPVDKQHRLPANCVPHGLVALPSWTTMREGQYMVAEAAEAFAAMVEDAAAAGHTILARSAYRSYDTQVAVYNSHVQNMGQERADRVSARPGHSEHQLGTTVDVTTPQVNYQLSRALGDTAAGRWLQQNSWNYGFVMSYPYGKEHITGYSYEPWHFRYVGTDIALQVRDSGLTLGEFLHRRR